MDMRHQLITLLLSVSLFGNGCVHRIHVMVPATDTPSASLPVSVSWICLSSPLKGPTICRGLLSSNGQ